MVPDFRRDDVWMPDQVRHDEKGILDYNGEGGKSKADQKITQDLLAPDRGRRLR